MADYRLSASIIKRSKGRSVIAAAAYRAGDKLMDERTGSVKDYTYRRSDILYTEILTPENAPFWMQLREDLWNAVEHREDRSTRRHQAQLARDVELSLPKELTHQQHVELVREFVKACFVDRGMVADIAIHAPPKRGDGTNHHAHILLTMREIKDGGFGRKNRDWNQEEQLQEWRERWEEYQNRTLEKYGHDERVDHRSLKDQGIDREPTSHLGPATQAMEDQGIRTDRGDENRRRLAANDSIEKLKIELADINRQIVAIERLQKLVRAVDAGYRRVEDPPGPTPEPPQPPKPETPERQTEQPIPEAPTPQPPKPPEPQAPISRRQQRRAGMYKELIDKAVQPKPPKDPDEDRERLEQQERERKNQQDRDRER